MHEMKTSVGLIGGILAVLTTVIGTSLAIDARYAKSQEVKQQFCQARKQSLRDRIFEIDLKENKKASDLALKEYLSQQLKEDCQ